MTPAAQYKPEVVAEWERRVAERRAASRGWKWSVVAFVAVSTSLPVLAGIVPPFPYVLVQILLVLVGLPASLHFGAIASLRCPNCEKFAFCRMDKAQSEGGDFCPHCYHWLRNPRRGTVGSSR